MNATTLRALGAISTVAIAMTGCGDEKQTLDQSSPTAVVKGYLKAVADDQPRLACQALAPAVQQRAVKLVGKPIKGNITTCEQALEVVTGQYTSKEQDLLRSSKVTKVKLDGTRATVTSTGSGKLTVQKSGGRWAISGGLFG